MRYMGIDYGSKRVGIALSDPTRTIATPYSVLRNSPQIISTIRDLCKEKDVALVVVGESKNFHLKDNYIMKEIRPFVENLKKAIGVEVEYHPEFMTSIEAEHIQGKGDMLDASAAALILKSYIDHKKR